MEWVALVNIAIGLTTTILQNRGVIGADTTSLVNSLLGPVENLIASLKAGGTKIQDTLAVLATASGVIAVLKANTNLSPAVLAQIDALDKDVQAALMAYVKSGTAIDLSVLTPLPLVA